MSTLLCFGLGYSADHYVRCFGDRFARIVGTVRDRERADELRRRYGPKLTVVQFESDVVPADLSAAVESSEFILVSVPPNASGDPVLTAGRDPLAQAPHLRSIVYLSTVGVYGDHGGAWVDEDSACHPMTARNRHRLVAEQAWQAFSKSCGVPVAILRLSGIYGPRRNALVKLKSGLAKRIVKPDQAFNRIHVFDIAQAIDAAFERRASGIFNVTDDEPVAGGEPIAFAASLLGIDPPPEIPFAEARKTMSPMALTFYGESKRARNDKLKSELGVVLRYPTYREGLTALHTSLAVDSACSQD